MTARLSRAFAQEDAKILKRQARVLGVISGKSAGENKEHCDGSRLRISPVIRKHSSVKPVEIIKKSTARKNKVSTVMHLVCYAYPCMLTVTFSKVLNELCSLICERTFSYVTRLIPVRDTAYS